MYSKTIFKDCMEGVKAKYGADIEKLEPLKVARPPKPAPAPAAPAPAEAPKAEAPPAAAPEVQAAA